MEIENYPNYLIYEDGRVWSKWSKGRFLKPSKIGKYLGYSLCINGEKKIFKLHRLIAIHYIPNPLNKENVDHIDGNKNNNNINNLRWVTISENNNLYKPISITNKSGFKNIYYDKTINKWIYRKSIYGKEYRKSFKNKNDAISHKLNYESSLSILLE